MLKRTAAIVLLLIIMLLPTAAAALEPAYQFSEGYMSSPYYERLLSVQLTGVQRTDLVNVALSQVGYHEGELGDYTGSDPVSEGNCTEYNRNYYGWDAAGDNYAWCAVFFTWCARNANISRDIIHTYNRAQAGPFGLIYVQFPYREPLPGDVAFVDNNEYRDSDHVAIVYRVDGNYIYTVEGNTENAVRLRRYERATGLYVNDDDTVDDTIHILYFGVAWYTTGAEGGAQCLRHIYTLGCEGKCAVCGAELPPIMEDEDREIAAVSSSVTAYSEPYSKPRYAVASYTENEHLHASAAVENSIGELWHRLDNGTFVPDEEVCYVYRPEELAPVMTVLEQGEGKYRVRIDSADENVELKVTVGPEDQNSAMLTFKSGKELWSDRPFAFSVKAVYKGVESETVSFAFDYIPDYFGEDPNAPDEEQEAPSGPAAGMAAFSVKRRYLGNFDDVDESDWFWENVKKTYELGILNGYADDEFGTDGPVTAAQAITIAARLHSLYYTGVLGFDASEAGWFAPYLAYALENGIIDEPPADPNAALDRKGFVSVLDGVFPGQELAPIADIPDGSIPDISGEEDYVNYIYTLYRAGILRGAGSLRFEGDSPVTRAQAAAIITRFVCPELRAD